MKEAGLNGKNHRSMTDLQLEQQAELNRSLVGDNDAPHPIVIVIAVVIMLAFIGFCMWVRQ